MNKGYRALCEFNITGAPTNIAFLQNLIRDPSVQAGDVHTRFVEDRAADFATIRWPSPSQPLFHARIRERWIIRWPCGLLKWMAQTPLPFLPMARQTMQAAWLQQAQARM